MKNYPCVKNWNTNSDCMRIIKITLAALLTLVVGMITQSTAAPSLDTANITFIQKDVSIADIDIVEVASGTGEVKRRKALLQEAVGKNNAVITGENSRAELQFNDGTITRLGQLTSFTFTPGTRQMNLKQGTALFQVPKGMGGTKIQAGPVTAAITGTTLMLQVFGDRVVLYVYEGSVDASGKSLTAGQAITIFNNGKIETSTFDPLKGVQTAALFTKFLDAPSSKTFEDALKEVLALIESGQLPSKGNDIIDEAILNEIIRQRRDLQDASKDPFVDPDPIVGPYGP